MHHQHGPQAQSRDPHAEELRQDRQLSDPHGAVPELQNEEFGAVVEVTNGVGISVERAMYSDALGQIWAAGTNALATRLP